MNNPIVIDRFPINWADFGPFALTPKGGAEYEQQILNRLPDGVYWCGDELLADRDFEWPADWPWQELSEIISDAADWMMESSDLDCWDKDYM